jgi:hypothetical protein
MALKSSAFTSETGVLSAASNDRSMCCGHLILMI